jgi:hypothetical protein
MLVTCLLITCLLLRLQQVNAEGQPADWQAPSSRAFIMFMGAAMSFTAFPVLASLLSSAGLLAAPIGIQVSSALCDMMMTVVYVQFCALKCSARLTAAAWSARARGGGGSSSGHVHIVSGICVGHGEATKVLVHAPAHVQQACCVASNSTT